MLATLVSSTEVMVSTLLQFYSHKVAIELDIFTQEPCYIVASTVPGWRNWQWFITVPFHAWDVFFFYCCSQIFSHTCKFERTWHQRTWTSQLDWHLKKKKQNYATNCSSSQNCGISISSNCWHSHCLVVIQSSENGFPMRRRNNSHCPENKK